MISYIKFKRIIDKKKGGGGTLIPIEYNKLPFKIKRTYILNRMPKNISRTGHAHKKLSQIIFCLSGKIRIFLSNGHGVKNKKYLIMSPKTDAIYLKPGLWRVLKNLQKETVVMVLASDNYKENDYIRNYKEFLNYKKKESI
jgi:dTDP-4-dehydrorhamnose 3,5-epimerase-like enzyme